MVGSRAHDHTFQLFSKMAQPPDRTINALGTRLEWFAAILGSILTTWFSSAHWTMFYRLFFRKHTVLTAHMRHKIWTRWLKQWEQITLLYRWLRIQYTYFFTPFAWVFIGFSRLKIFVLRLNEQRHIRRSLLLCNFLQCIGIVVHLWKSFHHLE